MSRKTAYTVNALIVLAYATIVIFSPTPWIMFGGFLLLALMIRCATILWMGILLQPSDEKSESFDWNTFFWNLILGLMFCCALFGILWWLGHFWLSGIKIIVPLISAYIAYQSTFPVRSLQEI